MRDKRIQDGRKDNVIKLEPDRRIPGPRIPDHQVVILFWIPYLGQIHNGPDDVLAGGVIAQRAEIVLNRRGVFLALLASPPGRKMGQGVKVVFLLLRTRLFRDERFKRFGQRRRVVGQWSRPRWRLVRVCRSESRQQKSHRQRYGA